MLLEGYIPKSIAYSLVPEITTYNTYIYISNIIGRIYSSSLVQ